MLEGLVCEFVELLREQSRFSSTLLPDLIGFGWIIGVVVPLTVNNVWNDTEVYRSEIRVKCWYLNELVESDEILSYSNILI